MFDNPPIVSRLEREAKLRLFESLHQLPEIDVCVGQGTWHRASGRMECKHCGLPYFYHPFIEEWGYGILGDKPEDVRLCDGRVVHL